MEAVNYTKNIDFSIINTHSNPSQTSSEREREREREERAKKWLEKDTHLRF